MSSEETPILVYGTNWCPDCIRVSRCLDANNILYQWLKFIKIPVGVRSWERLIMGIKAYLPSSGQIILSWLNLR